MDNVNVDILKRNDLLKLILKNLNCKLFLDNKILLAGGSCLIMEMQHRYSRGCISKSTSELKTIKINNCDIK